MCEGKLERKNVIYHEVGHAVLLWNFGFEIDRIMVASTNRSGYVLPKREPVSKRERVAFIIALLGGVSAAKDKGNNTELHGSSEDFQQALRLIASLQDLPEGADWGILYLLFTHVQALVVSPEIMIQMRYLVKSLHTTNCLLQRQIHKILTECPATSKAVRQCNAFLDELLKGLPDIIAQASAKAEQIALLRNRLFD